MSQLPDLIAAEYCEIAVAVREATGRILPMVPRDELVRLLSEISNDDLKCIQQHLCADPDRRLLLERAAQDVEAADKRFSGRQRPHSDHE